MAVGVQAQRDPTNPEVLSILPSYYMYSTTMNRPLSPEDPPTYDAPYLSSASPHSANSGASTSYNDEYTSSRRSPSISPVLSNADSPVNDIVADQTTQSWQETLLNNVHKLENLTFTNNDMSNAVRQSVHFTREIGQIGVKPTIFDPSNCEYAPGECLNGFVLIENTLKVPIPFDMYYVLFEGNYIFEHPADTENPITYKRFLEMYDLSASYNEIHVNRLTSEVPNHFICDGIYDELDDTYLTLSNRSDRLTFGNKRFLIPGRKYKRFFTFKIPERLLDSECKRHSLSTHIEMPPTLGRCHMKKCRCEYGTTNEVKDFASKNASIAYSVMTRFIGKRSLYESNCRSSTSRKQKLVSDKGDEFIILKETNDAIRIIPQYVPQREFYLQMKSKEQDLMLQNLKNRLEEKIKAGKRLLDSLAAGNYNESIAIIKETERAELVLAKLLQQYKEARFHETPSNPLVYSVSVPVLGKRTKRAPLSTFIHKASSDPVVGTLNLNTPSLTYRIPYIPSKPFRSTLGQQDVDRLKKCWRIKIPIDLRFQNLENTANFKFPKIKFVKTTMLVTTLKSEKWPVPLEWKHDIVFSQQQYPSHSDVHAAKFGSKDPDTFEANVKTPFREISSKLYKYLTTLPAENFRVSSSLTDDVKLICHLEDETVELSVNQFSISDESSSINDKVIHDKVFNFAQSSIEACKVIEQMEWRNLKQHGGDTSSTYQKQFEISLNLDTANVLGARLNDGFSTVDEITLVPGFQNCCMSRFYAIRLMLITVDDQIISVKVPLSVDR